MALLVRFLVLADLHWRKCIILLGPKMRVGAFDSLNIGMDSPFRTCFSISLRFLVGNLIDFMVSAKYVRKRFLIGNVSKMLNMAPGAIANLSYFV